MLCAYPDVLRADLQRFYGLNLDDLGYGLRARRAADLAANLPPEARIWGKLNSACSWSTGDYLLANIADATSFMAWAQTSDAAHGGRWKTRIRRPGETESPHRTGGVRTVGELYQLLGYKK